MSVPANAQAAKWDRARGRAAAGRRRLAAALTPVHQRWRHRDQRAQEESANEQPDGGGAEERGAAAASPLLLLLLAAERRDELGRHFQSTMGRCKLQRRALGCSGFEACSHAALVGLSGHMASTR